MSMSSTTRVLKRSDYETVKFSCVEHIFIALVGNIDADTMHVTNTGFFRDEDVSKRLKEIKSLGLVAIPVLDHPVKEGVVKHEGADIIARCGDLILSSDGNDTIIATPLTWKDYDQAKYSGDGVKPLRFGFVSQPWMRMIEEGTLMVL
jgi:hypothetical protein